MDSLYNRYAESSDWWEGHQNPSQPSRRSGLENQATNSPAAPRDGASLAGTSIEQISRSMKTWRNVTIQISNYSTTYTLVNPKQDPHHPGILFPSSTAYD
ncbi:hypothetical protein SRHO_G00130740 [Serrasalmus rhombeus]